MDKALQNICLKSLELAGKQSCVLTAIEELGELIVALSQFENRGKGTVDDIITEIADVELMCAQLRIIYGDIKVDQAKIVQTKKWVTQLAKYQSDTKTIVATPKVIGSRKKNKKTEVEDIEKIQKRTIKSFKGTVAKQPNVDDEADLIEAQRLADEKMINMMGDLDPFTGEIKKKPLPKPKIRNEPEVFVFDPDEPDGTFLYRR